MMIKIPAIDDTYVWVNPDHVISIDTSTERGISIVTLANSGQFGSDLPKDEIAELINQWAE